MKAVCLKGHGTLDELSVMEVEQPRPRIGEALVRIDAASLNHLDLWIMRGIPGLDLSFPHICGADGTGEVIEVASEEGSVSVGDKVVINPGISCGCCDFCMSGEQSLCDSFGILGEHSSGTFAGFITVPCQNLFPVPGHLSLQEAAAFPLTFLTAHRMLFGRAELRAGESVLIHGIGGGVSLAALQLARSSGCRVLVSSSSDEKLQRALKLGTDGTCNYTREKTTKAVKEFTNGKGVDLVVDSVGKATWLASIKSVRKGGRIVTCGATTGPNPETEIRLIFWKQISILGSTMGSFKDFRDMLNLVSAEKISPVVDRVYPLDDARSAYGRLEEGRQFGNIVLSTEENS